MKNTIQADILAWASAPRLQAYDINATFGDGQPGRVEKSILDKSGQYHLDTQAWEAGDIAYQGLKQLHPKGISEAEFIEEAQAWLSMACNDIYPTILSCVELGQIVIEPTGTEGLKKAWTEYDWCERLMFAFDFMDEIIATGADFENPLNTVLPLVLLARLDDAVIAEFCDGRGLPDVMLEIAALRDRITPPKHIQRLTASSQVMQGKLDSFKQARRKGADAIHTENRAMKSEVFQWLESQPKFKSNEAAAMAITKQQPIAHVTARDWYKEWKKLRSASTP